MSQRPTRSTGKRNAADTLLEGRWTFRGVYQDVSTGKDARGFPFSRVLFADLQIVEKELGFGEQWLNTKAFAGLGVVEPGTRVEFTARVEAKSKQELRTAGKPECERLSNVYRLIYPRDVRIVSEPLTEDSAGGPPPRRGPNVGGPGTGSVEGAEIGATTSSGLDGGLGEVSVAPVVELRNADSLTPHPRNAAIYGQPDEALLESIQRYGIIQSIVITATGIIIAGHRRWAAAKRLGLVNVPVAIFPDDDDLEILAALVESNRNRNKTNEELSRESLLLFEIETERARRRQATSTGGGRPQLLANSPEAGVHAGTTRKKVASALGIGEKKAEQARIVIGVIDRLNAEGRVDETEKIRRTLNDKSVHAAHRAAEEAGHIERTTKMAPAAVRTPQPATYVTIAQWHQLSPKDREAALHVEARGGFGKQSDDSIEWARSSWDPVTGCQYSCPYCYARDVAERSYPQKFEPVLLPSGLGIPQLVGAPPATAATNSGEKNVIVCSMADLFGTWVPSEWIQAVLDRAAAASAWNFIFLTKFPSRLAEFTFAPNMWMGTTVDCQARIPAAVKAFERVECGVKFLSVEPMLEPLQFPAGALKLFDWLIIGGSSHSTQTPEWRPPREWVNALFAQARDAGTMVYEKTNLWERLREYPPRSSAGERSLPVELAAAVRHDGSNNIEPSPNLDSTGADYAASAVEPDVHAQPTQQPRDSEESE